MEYICDELILPIMKSEMDPEFSMVVRFVAGEHGKDHLILIEFPEMEENPLEHPAIDELGRKLLAGYTKQLTCGRNGSGFWEIRAAV